MDKFLSVPNTNYDRARYWGEHEPSQVVLEPHCLTNASSGDTYRQQWQPGQMRGGGAMEYYQRGYYAKVTCPINIKDRCEPCPNKNPDPINPDLSPYERMWNAMVTLIRSCFDNKD